GGRIVGEARQFAAIAVHHVNLEVVAPITGERDFAGRFWRVILWLDLTLRVTWGLCGLLSSSSRQALRSAGALAVRGCCGASCGAQRITRQDNTTQQKG